MSSSAYTHGHFYLADKLKKSATPSCDIISKPAKYIVIGNFVTIADRFTPQIFNNASGLSEDVFDFVVRDFAMNCDLSVKKSFGDSIVICGTKDDLTRAKSILGSNFSYAFTDEDGLDALKHAEEEYKIKGNSLESRKTISYHSAKPRFDA